ncbi:serine proteinase stubble-like [Sipha flava]|uniref:Serine proteinase stubble-like n=4 Tax=Sipha flava TaxID=143950 RepID=A0A8B8GFZ7_9HEMI|nr:serine proteinase stubble-like [Sipha flava]
MKSHGNCSPMKSSSDKTLLFMIYMVGVIISNSLVKSYPSWDTQSTITDFGRNIRQLPCVSRRTGETGVCMFAYSCAKVNGTHLGTCIDRFYFGSCCKTQSNADVEVNEPDNYLNNMDNDVVGPPATASSNIKIGAQHSTTTDRYGAHSSPTTTFMSSYKPTAQFAVSSSSTSSTTSTSTSRNQYTEHAPSTVTTGTARPTVTFASSSTPGSVSSSYTTTISHSTKPIPSTTFSTAKPAVKPSSYKPPVKDPVLSTVQKPKPQTARPTVQFSVPSSTASNTVVYSPGHETTRPAASTSSYTTPRPSNSTTNAALSTSRPAIKPSSTTYKSTTPVSSSPSPSQTSASSPQKVKPHTTAKPTVKPKPSSSAKPAEHSSTAATEFVTGSSYATRSTVENVTQIIANFSATTAAMNSPTISGYTSPHYGSTTAVTSTSPTLVTWTTLDKVPVVPSESTKPPNLTYKPSSGVDGSTLPSWVKLPAVETHEPNASGTPYKESTTYPYSSTLISKPSTVQSISDNDIAMATNNVDTSTNSVHYSSSTLSMLMPTSTSTTPTTTTTTTTTTTPPPTTVTDSVEAANAPLNMSNYKDVCGRRLFPTARIVGGEKVSFGKWPWQISLRQWRTSTYLHKCGAALFNENWAVTAAHCVENVPPSDLLLRLGEHDLSVEEEPYGYEERRIQIVASHPQFDPRTFEYDLALLRFYEPVKFQPNIIPVCVPDDDSNHVGSSAYVTGWGRLYEDGPLPSVLQEVTVPVINNSVCETMYRAAGYIEHIPDIFICAGWKKGGFDSCEGDSGGPMVIQRPDKRWILAGIISWGIGCAEPNQPGVYTRISKFKDWINQILQF